MKVQKGFTLLELIVAISILLIVLPIGSSIFYTAFQAQKEFNRVVAAYLAQEAIEVIKNIRDSNYIYKRRNDPENVDLFYENLEMTSGGLQYDSVSFPDPRCESGFLKLDPFSGFFECASQGLYKRVVTLTPLKDLDGDPLTIDRIDVEVKVEWESGKKSLILKSEIYDWLR